MVLYGRFQECRNFSTFTILFQKSRIPLDEETCELGVGGSIEAVEIAVAEVDVKISSLSGVRQPRILLAGTDDGQILQVREMHERRRTLLPGWASTSYSGAIWRFLWRQNAIWSVAARAPTKTTGCDLSDTCQSAAITQ